MASKKSTNNKRKHTPSTSSNNEEDDDMFMDSPASKHTTPSPKKAVKRASTDSDDSDDDGVMHKEKNSLISPFEAKKHLNKIKENNGSKDPIMKNAIAAYCSTLKGVDQKELQVGLTKYLHLAIQPPKLPFSAGSSMMNEFFESVGSLKYIPGFPHKPRNQLICYAAAAGIDGGLGMLREASDRMKSDEKGRAKAEKEARKERASYLVNMQSFIEDHEDVLSEAQKKSVQATITRLDKDLHPEKYPAKEKKVPGTTTKKKAKKEPMSAFEHFLRLSADLYTELEPEKRMRKLQRKFDKLDEGVRGVYEQLALRE